MLRISSVLTKKPGAATEFLGADFAMTAGDFKDERRGLRMNCCPNF